MSQYNPVASLQVAVPHSQAVPLVFGPEPSVIEHCRAEHVLSALLQTRPVLPSQGAVPQMQFALFGPSWTVVFAHCGF